MLIKVFFICLIFSFHAEARETLSPVVKKVMPTVVSITIETKTTEDALNIEKRLAFETQDPIYLGAGIITDRGGYILTNRHVVENAKEIRVTTLEGKLYRAQLKGIDDVSDVALIKINPKEDLIPASLGDSDMLETGDFVFTIGNPFGLSHSVTSGIVSALSRDIKETEFDDYIQTDAPMNPGNSGGALFNLNGEVIGLSTIIYSKQMNSLGIGFAIPSNHLKRIYQDLKERGKVVRSTIGVSLKEINYKDLPALIVTGIKDTEQARKNDVMVGDVFLEYDGKNITSQKAFERDISWRDPGTTIIVHLVRDKVLIKKVMTLTPLKQSHKKKKIIQTEARTDGVQYKEIGLMLYGKKILNIEKESEAAYKGVKAGDEIVSLNGDSSFKTNELNLYIKESISTQKPLHFNMKDKNGEAYFVELMPRAEK